MSDLSTEFCCTDSAGDQYDPAGSGSANALRTGKADGNILTCEISKDGQTKTIKMKVEIIQGEDDISRVWIEFPEE